MISDLLPGIDGFYHQLPQGTEGGPGTRNSIPSSGALAVGSAAFCGSGWGAGTGGGAWQMPLSDLLDRS